MADEKDISTEKAQEAAPEAEPEVKKKGKLPLIIIIIVLVVLGAFIGLKSGKKAEKPSLSLGEIETLGPEFLANLADGRSYIRTNISVQLEKNFKAEELKKFLPTVRDAVILCLSSKGMEEMNSLTGKENLKREIAYRINEVLEDIVEKKPDKSGDKKKVEDKKVNDLSSPALPQGDQASVKSEIRPWEISKPLRKCPDWDSETGPILMVYFTDFATQ